MPGCKNGKSKRKINWTRITHRFHVVTAVLPGSDSVWFQAKIKKTSVWIEGKFWGNRTSHMCFFESAK